MRIRVLPQQVQIELAAGQSLYQALALAGLIEGPCGGAGRCGKCRVRYLEDAPPPQAAEQACFSAVELAFGWRLACLQWPDGPLEIELPPSAARETAVLDAFWELEETTPGLAGYGVALDLGTTTIAAQLLDLATGARLAEASCWNSQRTYGQDVISRIHHCQTQPQGTEQLCYLVRQDILLLLEELCGKAGLELSDLQRLLVAGNPTMIHLLAGINPTPLGQAPYTLVQQGGLRTEAAAWGWPLAAGAVVDCLPAVAAYLGGDLLAGVLAAELHQPGPTSLLLDLGTNGELILRHQGRLLACSTALGPALEGMNIVCGMRATPGAITDLWFEEGRLCYTTLGGLEARGLAGSGLLAAVAALRQAGALEESGRLRKGGPVGLWHGQQALLIEEQAGIVLTQRDIRQFQLVKGALRAGLACLLKAAHCDPAEVEQVLLAGGFGAHLPERNLLITGMLPPQFAGKLRYVGNSSLAGARLCLLQPALRPWADALTQRVDYLDLTQQPAYQTLFLKLLQFTEED